MKCEISGNHTISYQSLLLSTTVLNDILNLDGGAKISDGRANAPPCPPLATPLITINHDGEYIATLC